MDLTGIEAIAKGVMEMQGNHSPQAIFNKGGTAEIAILPLKDNNSKPIVINFIKEKVKSENIEEYILIMEGWRHRFDKDTKKKIKTDECLQISKFRKDGNTESITIVFEKIKGKIVWGERIVERPFTGHTAWNVYLEDVMNEVIKQKLGDNIEF